MARFRKSSKRATVGRPARRQSAAERGHSRLADSTRPIAIDRRLTTSRRSSWLLMLVAGTVALALAASLFVAPLQKYFNQDSTLGSRRQQLATLRAVNAELGDEIDRLQTNPGVEEASREELGYQNPGEDRVTVVETGLVPTDLPTGWPYDLVTRIAQVKRDNA